ncbi:MAG: hypoxanthine phosphoribosyltransferase [Oscillospiraceae bacterium]|nr:hypoxanthine phosphoribosyltransferase [Oscillospiraceae bacterium]
MHRDVSSVILTREQIQNRITELGNEISRDYHGKKLLLLGILKGSFVFISDLARSIDMDLCVDFITARSYSNTQSTGVIRLIHDITTEIEGYDVLVVEDILDSGRTLEYITSLLNERYPASVEICALLDKPSRRVTRVDARYTGFTVDDVFVVGYGLDYNEKYRNLPYIGALKTEIYGSS